MPAADYTKFVDPPTGFVFVELSEGWKFAGKVSAVQAARLPATVVSSLLDQDTESARARWDAGEVRP